MAEPAPPQSGFEERTFTSQNGLRLYFRDYGPRDSRRATALCLPGLTRNSRDFHEVALRLAADRRVLCPDYRGRGRSDYDPDWRNYDARVIADDLRHLLAATNTHGAVMIGVSLGGLIAIGLAAVVPSTVRAVVLDDVGPEVETSGMGRILEWIRNTPPQPDWEHAARAVRLAFPNLSIKTEAGWISFAQATYKLGADGRLWADWDPQLIKPYEDHGAVPADLWALYRGARSVPMLAVRGGESDLLSAATFRRMKVEKPDLVQVTVPGVGHAPTLTEPEVAPALAEFVARF